MYYSDGFVCGVVVVDEGVVAWVLKGVLTLAIFSNNNGHFQLPIRFTLFIFYPKAKTTMGKILSYNPQSSNCPLIVAKEHITHPT
jgi:hypothetical protein